MSNEFRYDLGKIDYNNSGRKNCKAAITWTLCDGRFSMSAEIWNPAHTDILCGGQCVDEVAAYFPHDAKVQRMLAVWKRWHLNDMRAGSPAQEAELKRHTYKHGIENHYDWALRILKAAGLQPDNGYSYGSAWLEETIPENIRAEIESWSK